LTATRGEAPVHPRSRWRRAPAEALEPAAPPNAGWWFQVPLGLEHRADAPGRRRGEDAGVVSVVMRRYSTSIFDAAGNLSVPKLVTEGAIVSGH
jgi:hypothetical protein